MGTKQSITGLASYLREASFNEELNLTSNGHISFHWANWETTSNYMKAQINANSPEHHQKLESLCHELDKLKNKTIWLKNKYKTLRSSLYDLYESYLDPRIRMRWFDREDEILVSTHNESGPYITLSSMRWIDKKTFASFVRRNLITSYIPQRNFRVGLNIPISVTFDNFPLSTTTFYLKQASEEGVVIEISDLSDITKALHSRIMYLKINLAPFYETIENNFHQIVKTFSIANFNEHESPGVVANLSLTARVLRDEENYANIKASDGKSFYIFVRYNDLNELNPKSKIKNTFNHFVKSVKEQLEEEMKEIAA